MSGQPWTDIEVTVLTRFYAAMPTTAIAVALKRPIRQIYAKANKLGLKKSEEFLTGPHSGRMDGTTGKAGRFQPGTVPWNKGEPGSSGNHANSRRTQFKKGQMAGAAQRNYVPIGSNRISKDGYLEIKTTDDHPVPARRWVGAHRLVWEATHGPVPDGHIVVFLPGYRTSERDQITVDRLECITQAENMRRNTLHRYPREITDAIRTRAVHNRRINHVRKQQDRQ